MGYSSRFPRPAHDKRVLHRRQMERSVGWRIPVSEVVFVVYSIEESRTSRSAPVG